MKISNALLYSTVALALAACASTVPHTEAERQQERAEARADSAREVADTHKAANKEAQHAQEDLRKAENETVKRDEAAEKSRIHESEARTKAAGAPQVALEKIGTAEAESRNRTDRADCADLSVDQRASCVAAADSKLNTAR